MKPIHMKARTKLAGFYKIEAVGPDGSRRILADWFPNLITNIGMNRVGSGSIGTYCQVGAGSTTPNVTDTALTSLIAATTSAVENIYGQAATAPYYGYVQKTWRFTAGQAAGNISEVGVGWGAAGYLFSRALVLDDMLSPTTITVLSDELIDVTYQLRMYAPTVDVTGTFVDAGTSISHDFVLRAKSVTLWGYPAIQPLFGSGATDTPQVAAYDGDIAALVTGTNSGANLGSATCTLAAYSSNSFKRSWTANFALGQGNDATGIKSFSLLAPSIGDFQFNVDPTIMKDNTMVYTITGEYSWDRA